MFERHRVGVLFGAYSLICFCLLAWSADRVVQTLKYSFYYLWMPAGSPLVAQIDQWGRFGRRFSRVLRADQRAEEYEARWVNDRLDAVRFRTLIQENERLTALLSLPQSPAYKSIAARVHVRDASDWFHSLLVHPAEPVAVGNAVITLVEGRPAVLGHVQEVFPDGKARVVLLTDPSSALSAHVDRNGEQGLAEGRGSNRLWLNYLYSDADIRPGDDVVSSGLGGVFPPNLLVGRVLDVQDPTGGSAKKAVLSPAARLGFLREIIILSPEKRP